MFLLLRWILNAAALFALAHFYQGITIKTFWAALIIVIVFGLINAIIGGILKLLTLPISILTLGIFTLVINALMFWLTSSIIKGFEVQGFVAAFIGALIYSIAVTLINWFLKK